MSNHTSLVKTIKLFLFQNAQSVFSTIELKDIEVARSKDAQFGDYQCNSAMKLAKRYGLSPKEWADQLIQSIEMPNKLLGTIETKGPGFINMRVQADYIALQLHKKANNFYKNGILHKVPSTERKKIVVDFSSPNTAKEMHVGHLRSTIIGDCLARVFEIRGHDVVRLNHIGDWGTSFGMLIEHICSSFRGDSIEKTNKLSLQDLMCLYKEAKIRFDTDPNFKKQAQLAVVRLQSGEVLTRSLWDSICQISRKAYQQIYDILHVRLTERGESFYNDVLAHTVKEYEEKGLVTISDGAKCIFLENFVNREGMTLPLIIQKSDGGYNYDTTDLAALSHRIRVEKADRIVIVTDNGQATHFQMIFEAAEKAKILDQNLVRVDHVPFGLVLGPDGKKFKTRSGETEKLFDLLTTAIQYAKKILDERNPEWDDSERENLAYVLGIGAVKYADLSSHRLSDYTFSYDRMLRFEGNTAAFIMYSYVRAMSILRKVLQEKEAVFSAACSLEHSSEIALALALLQFDEVVDEVEESLLPNRITEYLYYIAEQFNAFFRDCHVDGDSRQSDRLQLVSFTAKTLQTGLDLLGIEAPSRM